MKYGKSTTSADLRDTTIPVQIRGLTYTKTSFLVILALSSKCHFDTLFHMKIFTDEHFCKKKVDPKESKKKSAKAENRTRIARITALNTNHCTTLAGRKNLLRTCPERDSNSRATKQWGLNPPP